MARIAIPRDSLIYVSIHYMLTGTLHNNADYGQLTFHPILFQDEQMGSTTALDQTQAIPVAGPEHILRPHDARILPFPSIQQTWPWFDRVTLVQFQPFSRLFNYSVNITALDDFDNRYVGTSANRLISIDVEQSKLYAEGAVREAEACP